MLNSPSLVSANRPEAEDRSTVISPGFKTKGLLGDPIDPEGNLNLLSTVVIANPLVGFIAGVESQLATTVPVRSVLPF